jgi:hypothetical protein
VFDKAWAGEIRDPLFVSSDPEVTLQLTFTTSPWRVRNMAAAAYNKAMQMLAANDAHGIFAYMVRAACGVLVELCSYLFQY